MSIEKTQKDSKSSLKIKWKNLKDKIKTELAIIYLSTNDKKFLNINDAIKHQGILEIKNKIKAEDKKMIVDVKQLIAEVLKRNDWGVFFKGEPIISLPMQDSNKIYKVNEVSMDKLMYSLDEFIKKNKEDEWRDKSQNKSSD